jgi:hypothetical protein
MATTDMDECFVCGKPVRISTRTQYVELDTRTGEPVPSAERVTLGDHSQGCFPVGSDCARRIDPDLLLRF